MTFAERVAADYRELGLSPTAHAAELFRERLALRGVMRVGEVGKRRNGSRVRLAGLAVSIQHPMTAKNFVFIALEDETGMINVTVRPQVYTEYRAILHRNPLLVIDGTLQVEGEVLNVVARRIHPVATVIAEDARETRVPLAKQQRLFR
jgi:error-prone DNA polymerase